MADFRGQEPLGFADVTGAPLAFYIDSDIEYWMTGKSYTLSSQEAEDAFVAYLAEQNNIEGSDVAAGPYFEAFDDTGQILDPPLEMSRKIGHISTYYAVGRADQPEADKKIAFQRNSNFWDGVAQVAFMRVWRS